MKIWFSYHWLKVLAICMILGAITLQPVFYYQLTSWIVAGTALITALQAHDRNKTVLMWLFLFIGVIYNPFAPLLFPSTTWDIIHTGAALLFCMVILLLNPTRLRVQTA